MICDSYGLVHLYLEASKLCFICLFSIIYCLEVGQGELGYQNKRYQEIVYYAGPHQENCIIF